MISDDELRALAEALDKITPVMGLEELHHMETLDRAADFLRQCAEQRPVAWMHDGLASTNKERVKHDEMRNRSCGFKPKPIIPLYAAPAASQAEPIDPHMIVADDRFPDEQAEPWSGYDEGHRAGYALAQTEREPLSDDDINKLAWKQNLWTDHMIEFSFLAFARAVERAHGIGGGGSDAE